MNALRRAARAPGLWLGLCLAKLAIAFVFARPLRAVLDATVGSYTVTDEANELLSSLAQILYRSEAVAAVTVSALVLAAIAGTLLWLFLAGAVITRLARRCPLSETMGASMSFMPGITLITIYTLIPRGLFVFNLVNDPLGLENFWARAAVFLLGWTWCTLALDLARARHVLRGARALDPRPLVGAFLDVIKSPRRSLAAAGVALLGWGTVCATLAIGVWFLGQPWIIWAARALTMLGVAAALWRIAFAVEATQRPSSPDSRA